jgi:hypothetical protein
MVLLLVGWALTIFAALFLPGGHPTLAGVLAPLIVRLTWILAPIGLLIGLAATTAFERRGRAVLLTLGHAMLWLIAFAVAGWLRKYIVF